MSEIICECSFRTEHSVKLNYTSYKPKKSVGVKEVLNLNRRILKAFHVHKKCSVLEFWVATGRVYCTDRDLTPFSVGKKITGMFFMMIKNFIRMF